MAGKSLVLAEKPSVARDIAGVIGARQKGEGYLEGGAYVVTWALGHLVTLAEPEEYGPKYKSWNFESLPMLPERMKLVVIRESAKQYNIISSLLRRPDITEVIVATDAGREGELVARWILAKASCQKPLRRLWISSQTAKAIREGFANLKPGRDYDNLYLSAQSRAEADWLVGFNITRALTCKFNAQLSGGRVQTPTLALIVAREKEIKEFVPKDYYTVKAQFDGFGAVWADAKQQTRLWSKDAAQAILAELRALPSPYASVSALTGQYKQKAPPAAYDLTELQRDANKKYAYSAKETLSVMQSLYERHKLLTYPRTDSRYITEDVAATLPERLRSVAIGPYQQAAAALLRTFTLRYIVDSGKVTDHHAIIPTEISPNLAALSGEERNIYDLVVRRFLAVLSAPFAYEETKLTLSVGKHKFYAKGSTVKNLGWKGVYSQSFRDDPDGGDGDGEENEEIQSQALPPLHQGEKLKITGLSLTEGKTKPPPRYTEGTLLSAMENPPLADKALRDMMKASSGLGTPATRADIIEKLFSTFYIERRGKELAPTSKGIQLIDLVPSDLTSAELTARWEQTLTQISRGEAKSEAFLNGMRKFAAALVSSILVSDRVYRHDNMTREKCPDCGEYLLLTNGKKGQMLVCADRKCGYRRNVSLQSNARCPNCHKKLEIRGDGEKRLVACICGYREKYGDFVKRMEKAGAGKQAVQDYFSRQQQEENAANSAMADALRKWKSAGGGE